MSSNPLAGGGAGRWPAAMALLSILGVADSGYLLLMRGRSIALSAGRQGSAFCLASGCDAVNQGGYAEIAGVPLAVLGLAAYLLLLVLSVLASWRNGRSTVLGIVMLSGVGVSVSAYLVYLQVAVIKAICAWCVVSAFTMVSIFILSTISLGNVRPPDQPGRAGQQRAF